jgi:hypothetical protein
MSLTDKPVLIINKRLDSIEKHLDSKSVHHINEIRQLIDSLFGASDQSGCCPYERKLHPMQPDSHSVESS